MKNNIECAHDSNELRKMFEEIKMFMEDMFRMQTPDDGAFWDLEVDALHDYKFYFTNRNPYCLKNFSLKDIKFYDLQRSKLGYIRGFEKRKAYPNPKNIII